MSKKAKQDKNLATIVVDVSASATPATDFQSICNNLNENYGLPVGMKLKHLKPFAIVMVRFADQAGYCPVMITRVDPDEIACAKDNRDGKPLGEFDLRGLIVGKDSQEVTFNQTQITCLVYKAKDVRIAIGGQ